MNETKLNLKYHDKIQNCIDKRYCEFWALQLNDNTLLVVFNNWCKGV